MTLKDSIKRHEGLRLKAYKDTKGIETIGYGHNLKYGISQAIAELLLEEDISNAKKLVYTKLDYAKDLPKNIQNILIELAFWIGNRLFNFKKMLGALEKRDYTTAKEELKDSKLYRLYTNRVEDLLSLI